MYFTYFHLVIQDWIRANNTAPYDGNFSHENGHVSPQDANFLADYQ
jgi:hypothetical protein